MIPAVLILSVCLSACWPRHSALPSVAPFGLALPAEVCIALALEYTAGGYFSQCLAANWVPAPRRKKI